MDLVGELEVADISLPLNLLWETKFDSFVTEPADLLEIIPERWGNVHKGTFGHLFIVAGSPGKTGAAALAAQAALRSGTGLVTVGVPNELNHE